MSTKPLGLCKCREDQIPFLFQIVHHMQVLCFVLLSFQANNADYPL